MLIPLTLLIAFIPAWFVCEVLRAPLGWESPEHGFVLGPEPEGR